MPKITIDQLMAKMADLDTDEADLAEYFILDEEASGAFAPQFKLNPATVQLPKGPNAGERSAMAMNAANWFARMNRKGKFYKKLRGGYAGPIIVSEGDSWFQYPVRLIDTIDHLMDDYAIFSLGAAGDLLQRMADKQEYLSALRETGAEILLLSGGGNDLVAGGALASHLESFDPDLRPEEYLLPSFHALLDDALMHYSRMFAQVRDAFPHVSIICHGYDYPVPNNDRWLGKPMQSRGIRSRALQKQIATCMMDQFNARLRRAVRNFPHVTYIDCRGVVGDHRWFDGLHPKSEGYADVASRFAREIRRLSNSRSGPPIVMDGPFGRARTLRSALAAPQIAGPTPKGISLHVGLNTVDPAHYAGWDGALQSCEADAHDMQALADAQGFQSSRLLTSQATREAVVAGIKDAADKTEPGDIFMLTVSAHGGRIPDFNRDEDHDLDVPMDETLCLYDFQLADDELFMLWSEFKPGVRVLVVPDTCHSGSMVRMGPGLPQNLFGQPVPQLPGIRAMPGGVEDQVWRANEAQYRAASDSLSAIKESVMMSPLSTPIRASVLNFGACKDEQFAQDGPANGAFTGALLSAWNNGSFTGNYRSLRDAVDATINSPSQTPQLFEKLMREPMFAADTPFTIGHGAPAVPMAPAHVPRDADEGIEHDTLDDEQVAAIIAAKSRGAGFRNAHAALNWPDYAEFDSFIRGLGLRNFATDEFLVLGGSHNGNGPCAGKNTYPPKSLWQNMAATARALDHVRERIGKPIVITNAYRAPAYNACINGARASQHMKFTALDFKVSGMAAPDVAKAVRWLRDREGLFRGGIGQYNSFTHIDTRGHNATWPRAFANSPLPGDFPAGA